MGAKYIPPNDPNEKLLKGIKKKLLGTLDTFNIRNQEAEDIASQMIVAIKPMLKLYKKPEKGATVMTEAASTRRSNDKDGFTKGPSNL